MRCQTYKVCLLLYRFSADLEIQLEEVGPFTVMRGDPLVVSITIEGFPPPNVIWSRDGVTISNNTMRTVGSTGISLSRVTPDDAGTYLVTAENGFSSDTETFEIIVICKCLLPECS